MKLVGYLLMTAALVLGTISAMTSYVPKLSPALEGLELNADAGVQEIDGERVPLVAAVDDNGDPVTLTAEIIAELEAAGVERVAVKSFEFGRWTHWPYFLLAVVMMVGGATAVRRSAKRHVEESTSAEGGMPPAAIVEAIEEDLASLHRELEDIFDEHARLVTIVDRVGDIQGNRVLPFFELRSTLIGTYGLAGFAGVMDRFSALERSLNRAWSAAADGHLEESTACLSRATELVGEVRDRLGTRGR